MALVNCLCFVSSGHCTGGRSVVENAVVRFSTTHLTVYLTTCYDISVVEWSIFTTSRARECACAILKYYIWTEAYFLLTSSRHVSAKFKKWFIASLLGSVWATMVIKLVACLSVTLLVLPYYRWIDSLRLLRVCSVWSVIMNLLNVK